MKTIKLKTGVVTTINETGLIKVKSPYWKDEEN